MDQPLTVSPLIAPPRAAAAGPAPAPAGSALRRAGRVLLFLAVCAAVAVLGWRASNGEFYRRGSDFAYWLGVVGGTMMLVLLSYPLRKHIRVLGRLGALKHWFRLHMLCGIGGPLLILFHSRFHSHSLNATVALTCMLLVAFSGVIGRFIYRHIHHGLYGRRSTLRETEDTLARDLALLAPSAAALPEVGKAVDAFGRHALHPPRGLVRRAAHFAGMGMARARTRRRIRRMLARHAAGGSVDAVARRRLAQLGATADETLEAYQRTAQFAAWERLFALWHVLHVPFVYMLAVSAVVHVVAVHAY